MPEDVPVTVDFVSLQSVKYRYGEGTYQTTLHCLEGKVK
jgi:hypothetical protein